MFANDTQIGTASNDAIATAETLNEDLENISVWMATNKLSLNKSKTEFLLIGSHQKLKRECPLRPSKRWHMMKNQNSSYFVH